MAEKSRKALLSKSTFIKGMQCRKALYLYKNRYFLRDPLSPEQRAKFLRGTNVGIFAQQLFPGGVDASPATHFQMAKSVEKTTTLIAAGNTEVIYEAAFSYDDVVVALDILYRKDGRWCGAEVKSSTALSQTYHWDAALQYYVITGSGLDLADFSIAYINKDFKKDGPIDLCKLFVLESRWDDVRQKRKEVGGLIIELKETIALKKSPETPIGDHCHDPYPCEFIGHCWKKVPDTSVFLLKGVERSQQFAWYHQGIEEVAQLPDEVKQNPLLARQLKSIEQKAPVIDQYQLQPFLSAKKGKHLLMHTFAFAPAIPIFDGTQPYQSLPFALGWYDVGTAHLKQTMVMPGENPMTTLAKLLPDIARHFDILWVFDADTERTLLQQYATLLPHYAGEFASLKEKMRSLQTPLLENWIVYPHRHELSNPEEILGHFGQNPAKLPEGLQIQQQADALYQKILLDPSTQFRQEGMGQLEAFVEGRVGNLVKLIHLFNDFST